MSVLRIPRKQKQKSVVFDKSANNHTLNLFLTYGTGVEHMFAFPQNLLLSDQLSNS